MSLENKKFLLCGLAIAMVIAVLTPFLASKNLDSLDSTIEKVMDHHQTDPLFESPFPDYTVPALGEENFTGGVISLVLGTLLVLGIAFGLGKVLKKKD